MLGIAICDVCCMSISYLIMKIPPAARFRPIPLMPEFQSFFESAGWE
jgi:hypothetical protein